MQTITRQWVLHMAALGMGVVTAVSCSRSDLRTDVDDDPETSDPVADCILTNAVLNVGVELSDQLVESFVQTLWEWIRKDIAFPGLESTAKYKIDRLRGLRGLGNRFAIVISDADLRTAEDFRRAKWHFFRYDESEQKCVRLDPQQVDAFENESIDASISMIDSMNKKIKEEVYGLTEEQYEQYLEELAKMYRSIVEFADACGFPFGSLRFDVDNLFFHAPPEERGHIWFWVNMISVRPAADGGYWVQVRTGGTSYMNFRATITNTGVVGHPPVYAGTTID